MKYFNLQFNLHPDHIVIQFSCTFRNDFSETYSTNMIQYQICKMNDLNPLNVFVNKFRDLSQRARTIYIKTITCTQEEINWNRKTRLAEKEAKRWSVYHFIVMKWASITTDANREIRIFVCHYHYASVQYTPQLHSLLFNVYETMIWFHNRTNVCNVRVHWQWQQQSWMSTMKKREKNVPIFWAPAA